MLKYGFIDVMTGEVILPFIYESVYTSFSPEGIAAVMLNDRWGLIDRTGTFIVPANFAEINIGSESADWKYMLDDNPYDKYGRLMEPEDE